ncbi:hypothetical protein Tco_0517888 [Tanacetum coccineum]
MVISSDNISDFESTDDISSSDTSSQDIVSSKGPSRQLLKWYDYTTNDDIPEFEFSKSVGLKASTARSSATKAKASKFNEAPTLKNQTQTLTVLSPVPIKNLWKLEGGVE